MMQNQKNRVGLFFVCMLLILTMLLSLTACTTGVETTSKSAAASTNAAASTSTAKSSSTTSTSQSAAASTSTSAATSSQGVENAASSSSGEKTKGSNGLLQSPNGKLKIAYLLDSLTNDSSQRHWQQVQNECKMRDWELIYDNNVSGNYEADATRKAFQNMMEQSPDAIVISYLDIPPIADLCVQAHEKGIGVYCIGTDISDGIMMNVCSNNSVIGAKVMAYVMDRLGGEANVMGFQTLWMTRGIRRDEVAKCLAQSKTYNVKTIEQHEVTQEGFTDEMFSVTQNWLTKYGSDLDFVWACWTAAASSVRRPWRLPAISRTTCSQSVWTAATRRGPISATATFPL
jgi:ABC-type sugar transport system substrate-binding protein